MARFTDQVVVITGAAGGIGVAVAKAFVAEGAHLALIDANATSLRQLQAELVALSGGSRQIEMAVADLATEEGVRKGVREVLAPFQRVDVLVANVGKLFTGDFEATSVDDWLASFQINFFSHIHAIKAVLPYMKAQKSGHIILMGSDQALQPDAGQSAYGQAKAALHHLGKTLARELPRYGIQVSVLAPGMTRTPLVEGVFARRAEALNVTLEQAEALEISERGIPLRRLAEVEEIAKAVLFLAEVPYSNGTILEVSGGNVKGIGG